MVPRRCAPTGRPGGHRARLRDRRRRARARRANDRVQLRGRGGSHLLRSVAALVHNGYEPEEEWTRAELELPKPGSAPKPSTAAVQKLVDGGLAKDRPLPLAKPPKTLTGPERTRLAALETVAREAHEALVAARAKGDGVAAAARRYRDAVAAQYAAVDTLRAGVTLATPAPEAKALGATEREALLQRMAKALEAAAKPGATKEDAALVVLRVVLSPEEFAAFEKASRALAPTPTALEDFEEALVRAEAMTPNDPLVRAAVSDALTRYRKTALERLESKGGDAAALEQAVGRARYLDAKRIIAAPDQHRPAVVARAKDVVAAYEGQAPSFEQYKAEKAALDAELKDVDAELEKYPAGPTGGTGEGSAAAARLLAAKKELLRKRQALDRRHEEDVVEAAKKKSATETASRGAKLAELERKLREAKDPALAQALAKQVADEKAALAAAEAKAVADAKAGVAKTTTEPLRAQADKTWLELRQWRAQANVEGRAKELREVEAELQRANKQVTDLTFEVDHYEHRWTRSKDGPQVTRRLDADGKVIAKEVVQAELVRAKAERDKLALRVAAMKRDLAQLEHDDVLLSKVFWDAESAAIEAELRLATAGEHPLELPGKQALAIRDYMKSIGKPLPEETSEQAAVAMLKARLAQAKRMSKEAGDAVGGKERRLVDAEAAVASAKAKLDATKVEEALATLAGPPPLPHAPGGVGLAGGLSRPNKQTAPKVGQPGKTELRPKSETPGPKNGTEEWDVAWKGLGAYLDATNPIPKEFRADVAKLAEALVDITEQIDKGYEKLSDDELRALDAETAQLKALSARLRAANNPALNPLLDLADAVVEARKQLGHFKVGVRDEFVQLLTGTVGLAGKLVRFNNDPAYRDEVKDSIEKLVKLTATNEGNAVLFPALQAEFEKDPARALGRVTGFIATFLIPFEDAFAAVAQLGRSVARLTELANTASKVGKVASESAAVAKDLSVAARALERAGVATRSVNGEIQALLSEAKALRLAGRESEALSKLASANARIDALRTVAGATREWEKSAQAAVDALKMAKADAATLKTAEADLARAQAALKEIAAAEKLASDAGKVAEAEGALAKAQAAVGDAAKAGDVGRAGGGAAKPLELLPPKCFVAGTKVLVASDGATSVASHKAIEDIVVGDLVVAESPETGELAVRPVTQLFRSVSRHVRRLDLVDGTGRTSALGTTDGHPFFVEGRGWVLASDLREGDTLRQVDGGQAKVVGSVRFATADGTVVFNFEVEGLHDYFVSAHDEDAPVLVHNRCLEEILTDLARTDPARAKAAREGWQRLQALGDDARFARLMEEVERGKAPESRAIDVCVAASERDAKDVLADLTKRLDKIAAKKAPAEVGTYPGTTKVTETMEALQKTGVPAGVPIKSEYGVARELVTGLPTADAKGGFTWHAEKMDAALRGLQDDAVALRKMLPELERLAPKEALRAQALLDAVEARILEIKPFMDQYRRRHLDYPSLWEVQGGKIVPKLPMPFDPKVNGPARLPNMLPGETP